MRVPSKHPCIEDLVKLNVETVTRIEEAALNERTTVDRLVDAIAQLCGSMTFVYFHVVFFGAWILFNTLPAVPKAAHFDPSPFTMLTLVVSLEAIFLSTFILISQNRQQKISDHQNRLDLQINLLSEQENSRMIAMLREILERVGGQAQDVDDALAEATDIGKIAVAIEQANPQVSPKADGDSPEPSVQ